jgi:lysozyme
MRTNDAGLEIIRHFEGFSPVPYLCPAGIATIGYGSIRDAQGRRVTLGHGEIDRHTGELLLARHLRLMERRVARLVAVKVTSNEFSALVSFAYNLGSGAFRRSTLRAKLNRGDRRGAADEFPKWRRAGGRVLRGLERRRAAERALFLA